MTAATVAVACERDPHEQDDIDEIEAALQTLLEDGLAEQKSDPRREPDSASELDTTLEAPTTPEPHTTTLKLHTTPEAHTTPHAPPQPLYRPTRAAIRARELSF